jgi:hypothetical protein
VELGVRNDFAALDVAFFFRGGIARGGMTVARGAMMNLARKFQLETGAALVVLHWRRL